MKRSLTASAETEIPRPLQEVWDFVTDVRNLEKWVDGMSDVRPTSDGEFGVGSTYAATYACGGSPAPIECEVTEFVPMRTNVSVARG